MKQFQLFLNAVLILLIVIPLNGQSNINASMEKSGSVENIKAIYNPASIIKFSKIQLDSIPPDQTGMRDITSVDLAKEMVPGWNVGNSLEAIGGETAWGNPKITQKLIDSVKAAGFNAIRIPVAWSQFSNDTTFTIKTEWLDRVEEVVNYVLSSGLYAIINEHWDNGWIQPTYAQQQYVNNRLAVMWEQIAVRFRDYDDHLLFAGTNEVMVENNYGTPTKEYYTVQNSYNQTFVNTVRSTGGRNYYRHLLVQGFNTNINYTVSYFTIPNDVVANRLIVEVHYYDPYNFTINSSSKITQWGKYATDASKTETWANESYADAQFNKMKTKFVDKGYPVIIGEYGAMSRLNLGSTAFNEDHAYFRRYYMNYITSSIVKYGLVPFYWDNGSTGDLSMGIFNRSAGAKAYPSIIKAIMDAVDTTEVLGIGMNDLNTLPNKFSLMQNYPNPFNPTTNILYTLTNSSKVKLSVYDLLGRKVAVLVDKNQNAGTYEAKFPGENLASGVYLYRLQSDNQSITKKMMLIK